MDVGADGGIGPITPYCLSLLGSEDITELDIGFLPEDQALFDYGHIDLWIADNAPEFVWQPILDWVGDHTQGGPHPHH